MKTAFFFVALVIHHFTAAQQVKGVVADSATKSPLSFATVQTGDGKHSVISGINGKFSLTIPSGYETVTVSFIGYKSKTHFLDQHKTGDTVFLSPSAGALNEVVIYSNEDKIRRIINTTVRNKDLHNPEQYNLYECNIYYKTHMKFDGLDFGPDSAAMKRDSVATTQLDTSTKFTDQGTAFLLSETYTKRVYRKPQQLQEIVMASRFSGMKKTFFTNVVTDMVPFHIYGEYISLNAKDYNNPIAKGWQNRYKFRLSNELIMGKDTVFLMEFEPKNTSFNGLKGLVYINSNGYAISHFVGSTPDTTADRVARLEHIYSFENGKWFPKELNFNILIRKLYKGQGALLYNGHSLVDSVYFDRTPSIEIDKAHSIKLSDSVDLRSAEDWNRYRLEPITEGELQAYKRIDALSEEYGLEKKVFAVSYLAVGRLPIGKIDLDINRFMVNNRYEGTRFGAGFFTNTKISKFFSAGAWGGYGIKDKEWKYGGSLSFYPSGSKENSFGFSYQNSIRNPGEVIIHPELTRMGLRNWLLGKVDKFEQVQVMASLRKGYWELLPEISQTTISPLYANNFLVSGLTEKFENKESALGIRYAYGEKRAPVLDYYMPVETKYPLVYLNLAYGEIRSGKYVANYGKIVTAITYNHHINRWGNDMYRIEGGMVQSFDNRPLPLSFLLAGNGIRMRGLNYYTTGGFITMLPYDYFSDRYISFLYKHDFDRFLWDKKMSKPFISLAHNMIYGSLQSPTRIANPDLRSFSNGYHESGILFNQLIRKNLHFADVNLGLGAFYKWSATPTKENVVAVFNISVGF